MPNFSIDSNCCVEKKKSNVLSTVLPSLFCSLVIIILFWIQVFKFRVFSISSCVKLRSGFRSQNMMISGSLYVLLILLIKFATWFRISCLILCLKYTPMTKCICSLRLDSIAIMYCLSFRYTLLTVFFLAIIHTPWNLENAVWNISYSVFISVGLLFSHVSHIIV